MRFSALCEFVRDTRRDTSRFTPVRSGYAPRSLFRAAFRYPKAEPPHNRAGPALRRLATLAHSFWQRSWDLCTLHSFPHLQVRAFVNRFGVYACAILRRSSPHAVIESQSAPLIFTIAGARI